MYDISFLISITPISQQGLQLYVYCKNGQDIDK